MRLFDYWWLESHQYENPGTPKEIAWEAWKAAKVLHSKSSFHQADPPTDAEKCPNCIMGCLDIIILRCSHCGYERH